MQSGSLRAILAIKTRFKRTCRLTGFPRRNETVFVSVDRNFLHGGGVVVGIPVVSLGDAIGTLVGVGAVSVPMSRLGEDWML